MDWEKRRLTNWRKWLKGLQTITGPWTRPHGRSMTMLNTTASFRDQSCSCFGPEETAKASRDSASSQAPRTFHCLLSPQALCIGLSSTGKFLFSLSGASLTLTHPSDLSFNHKEALLPTHIPAHTHTHTPVHTHYLRTHTHMHTYARTCAHTCIHAHTPQINSVLPVIPSHSSLYFCEPILSPEETHSTVRLGS